MTHNYFTKQFLFCYCIVCGKFPAVYNVRFRLLCTHCFDDNTDGLKSEENALCAQIAKRKGEEYLFRTFGLKRRRRKCDSEAEERAQPLPAVAEESQEVILQEPVRVIAPRLKIDINTHA